MASQKDLSRRVPLDQIYIDLISIKTSRMWFPVIKKNNNDQSFKSIARTGNDILDMKQVFLENFPQQMTIAESWKPCIELSLRQAYKIISLDVK